MMDVSTLESRIDDLYRLPLREFVAARDALAKTVSGEEARRTKRLTKPTALVWAVNQVYWHARPLYDRLLKSGAALRDAQTAVLEGRSTDVRSVSNAHRAALADSVTEAIRLAAEQGVAPAPDALGRLFEAVSLVPDHPESPGRLTRVHRLTGFDALASFDTRRLGTHSMPMSRGERETGPRPAKEPTRAGRVERSVRTEVARKARSAQREQLRLVRERRAQEKTIVAAERAVERARKTEADARRDLASAQQALLTAERALAEARARSDERSA
jgi:hypothetical protein